MLISSMVRLVEHEQTNIVAEVYVSMAKRVKEHVVRANDDAVRVQYTTPQRPVLPLVRLVRARDEPDRDGKMSCDD